MGFLKKIFTIEFYKPNIETCHLTVLFKSQRRYNLPLSLLLQLMFFFMVSLLVKFADLKTEQCWFVDCFYVTLENLSL